jgi:predicted  nucleic acid-binding Zn-ribbon protein
VGKEAPGHAYDISRLNVFFALTSVGLFFTTVWMLWADYSREWKGYQRQFVRMERQLTRTQLEEAQGAVDPEVLSGLEQDRVSADEALAQNQQTIDELESKQKELSDERVLADIDERELKSIYDSAKFYFEEGGHAPLGKRVGEEDFRELEQEFFAARDKRIALDYDIEQLDKELRELRAERTGIEAERRSLTERIELVERKLNTIKPSFANFFRNLPVVDFIDPSIEIKQVLVRNVTENLNFTEVPRIDRCMTCHLGIDNPDYADAEQPFRTHPRLDVFVNRESAHPVDDFGCTSCHSGRGRATAFVRATHTPRDEVQKAEWEEKYHWKEDHSHVSGQPFGVGMPQVPHRDSARSQSCRLQPGPRSV